MDSRKIISRSTGAFKLKHVLKTSLLSFFLITLAQTLSWAHPHVFISQNLGVVFDDKGLAGFRVRWVFDEMFTAMIVADYDKNKNGVFGPDEVALVRKEAFDYIAEFNYFTFVTIEGKPFQVKFVKDFNASLPDGKSMMYEFFIPCHVTAIANPKHVTVATYDPSYYSALFFSDTHPATVENPGSLVVNTEIKEDTSTSIYFGQIHPWALFVNFKKK